jgi:hypothetical protein
MSEMRNADFGLRNKEDANADILQSAFRNPHSPSYLAVFWMFARNSLIRDMTFRANFIIETISSLSWAAMNLGFYTLVYSLMARGPVGHRRLDAVPVLRVHRDDDPREQSGRRVLHGECRGAE